MVRVFPLFLCRACETLVPSHRCRKPEGLLLEQLVILCQDRDLVLLLLSTRSQLLGVVRELLWFLPDQREGCVARPGPLLFLICLLPENGACVLLRARVSALEKVPPHELS